MISKVKIGLEWETLVELPKERRYYAMVAIGRDSIAIVGGWDLDDLKSVPKWSIAMVKCSALKSLPVCVLHAWLRAAFAMTVVFAKSPL